MSDASLRGAYRFWAPLYDTIVGGIGHARRRSIELLAPRTGERILLVAVDLTPATLRATPALRITHREPSVFGGLWQIVQLEKARGAGARQT